tara:strand:+ start:707 stop:1792 length:1086 start_codon:yes stop_codon:yes gene_type:complete
MKKIIFYNVTLVIFLFLLTDVLLSIFYLKTDKNTCFNFNHKINFYDLKKNCSAKEKFNSNLPSANVTTSDLGLRINYKSKSFNSESKVFFFGDSFTFGVGVDNDKTFVNIIEQKNQEYQFYNFAVPSYSPSVYLYQLKTSIQNNIIPKKIILFLDLTDIYDEGVRWKYNDNKMPFLENKAFEYMKANKKFTEKYFVFSKSISSNINNFFREIRYKRKINNNQENLVIRNSFQASFTYLDKEKLDQNWWSKEKFDKGITKTKKRIDEISKISQDNEIEFYLVIYPWKETLYYGQEKFDWENFANEICSQNKCSLINLFPIFEEVKKEKKFWLNELYFLNDPHFNEKGHKVVADFVEAKIFTN